MEALSLQLKRRRCDVKRRPDDSGAPSEVPTFRSFKTKRAKEIALRAIMDRYHATGVNTGTTDTSNLRETARQDEDMECYLDDDE